MNLLIHYCIRISSPTGAGAGGTDEGQRHLLIMRYLYMLLRRYFDVLLYLQMGRSSFQTKERIFSSIYVHHPLAPGLAQLLDWEHMVKCGQEQKRLGTTDPPLGIMERNTIVWMHACMYVCMYLCMYFCYVFIYVCIDVCIYVWKF